MDVTDERCDGSTSLGYYPNSVEAMSRSRIYFPRGCEAVSCCFGKVCTSSSEVWEEDGKTVCATPLVGNADSAQVSLRTPSGVMLPGAEPLRIERAFGEMWSGGAGMWAYVYERWRWQRSPTGTWTYTLTGNYRVCQSTWGASDTNVCCQLVGLDMDFNVLPLPVEWCSSQRWGCSDVGKPWEDAEVTRRIGAFQLRALGLRCRPAWSPDGDLFFPAPLLRHFGVDRLAFARAWADRDAEHRRVASAILQVVLRYQCPAHAEFSPRPRQLWAAWSLDPSWAAAGAATCLQAWPAWWRGLDGGVRCCYDGEGQYIPAWPSRVIFYSVQMGSWSWAEEREVERVTCAAEPRGDACAEYARRRPAVPPTNNPYWSGSGWEVPRPFGGGWGDPHCKSIDGLEFECNFHGEAVWAGCGSWQVHAVAERFGNSSATIITAVAVRHESETLVARLNASVSVEVDEETGLAPPRYVLLLNGTEPRDDGEGGASGAFLTATAFNNVLTIEDVSGNVLKASFLKDLIVLQVAPRSQCFNRTFGLSGNNNGNKSDDLVVRGTGEVLSENAPSAEVFDKFVKSYLIKTLSDSLFPPADFVPVEAAFTPQFADQLDLSQCPAACNGKRACCLDASQGGAAFVEAFTTAMEDVAETNKEAVGFFDNMRPAFEEAPSLFVFAAGSQEVQLRYRATDADGIGSLSCDICPNINPDYANAHGVTCDISGIGTNSSLMVISAQSLGYGGFKCFSGDLLGANVTIATSVVEEDTTASVEFWEKEEEANLNAYGLGNSTSTSVAPLVTSTTTEPPPRSDQSSEESGGLAITSAPNAWRLLPLLMCFAHGPPR